MSFFFVWTEGVGFEDHAPAGAGAPRIAHLLALRASLARRGRAAHASSFDEVGRTIKGNGIPCGMSFPLILTDDGKFKDHVPATHSAL
jgi:hypothetical protein